MSATTSDWALTQTDRSVTPAEDGGKVHRREEEFRSALANYMAGYVADQQRRRASETVTRDSYFTVLRRFAGRMRDGYRLARTRADGAIEPGRHLRKSFAKSVATLRQSR